VIPHSGVTFFIELKGADWVQAQPTGAFSFSSKEPPQKRLAFWPGRLYNRLFKKTTWIVHSALNTVSALFSL